MNPKKDIAIIYHKDCPDGFSGAWSAYQKFGNKAEYIPFKNRWEFPEIKDKEVYIIDLNFTKPILKQIKEKNKKVIVIDHHKSAVEYTGKIVDEYQYDGESSACTIAWKYFFPKKPVPRLLKYVEDIDIWKFQLPHSEEISEVGRVIGYKSFEKWSRFAKDLENEEKRKEKIKIGKILLEYKNKITESIAEFAYEVEFEGMKILAVNNSRVFRSQIGHLLAKRKPPMGIIWQEEKDGISISLRSDGSIDVSEIAKKYGGGGHAGAAGFLLKPDTPLPWKRIKS